MTNATGWAELYDGRIVEAAYTVFNTALHGWTIGILFLVFEAILLMKTRNPASAFISALIFVPLYVAALTTQIAAIAVALMVFMAAAVFYMVIFK